MTRPFSAHALRLTLAGAALALTIGGAVAQAPGNLAPVPTQQTVSPSHLALGIEVVKVSGMSRSIEIMVPEIVFKARQLFTQSRPELAGEIDKSVKALQADFEGQKAEALRLAGEAFANRLTEAELKDIETFYKSASGQKFVSSQPAIMENMFRNLDGFDQRFSQYVVDKLREDMKKRGITL